MSKYENCVQAAMAQWRNFLNISIMKNETEVFVMKDKTYHAYLDSHERQLVIHSLVLYFFGEMTYEQIAALEGCTKRAVKFSVDIAIEKLKKDFGIF